ncbi:hypothetical protein PEPS_37930 (plasmid) [Persicobacter psychrovividus]|uniref:Uncharacterized protein n=1 Tax=Persicobacter psychrovividus TaxID=387638 RepID=A0ABM7VKJ4_9BACT|nr:hypothetical protein PEPS_37930 [Persicobacter psychrovividus]
MGISTYFYKTYVEILLIYLPVQFDFLRLH